MTKVLLVDDETIILHVLSAYLKIWHFEITSTSEGPKAVEILESDQPLDIMVSDIRMFPINGIELLKISRNRRPDMPVILITGFGSKETFKQAETLGAFKCLSKPFEPETLLRTINEAVKANC